jgi:nucleoside-diphosphate-sugar epimerase
MGERVLVTGAAGFVGSHVCERLLDAGHEVVGADCFTGYYARAVKERNLERAREWSAFELVEADLAEDGLRELLDGVGTVIHLAAQPGVRSRRLGPYVRRNVIATQRLLEAAAAVSPLRRFVYASSSSVYGDAAGGPATEQAPLAPLSPYAVTKVAAERLVEAYRRRHGVPAVGLRFFTIYGPRQRPDMAFHRFITRCLDGDPIELIGDGRQVRDFTYVADAVEATLAAVARGRAGAIYNVGGGHPVELRDAIALIAELVGSPVRIARRAVVAGEARRTECDGTLARRELGFAPQTPLGAGIARQFEHMAEITRRAPRRNQKSAGRPSVVQVEVTDTSTTRIRGTAQTTTP